MQPAPALAAVSLFASSLAWAIRLVVSPDPLGTGSAILLALGLLGLGLIAITGLLLPRSPWARRFGFVLIALQGTLIAVYPGLGTAPPSILSALAAVALAAPALGRWLRPSSGDGPPPRAVLMLLALVATPVVGGLASPHRATVPLLILASAGPIAAVAFGRASIGALWAIRISALPFTLVAALSSPPAGAAALVAYGAAITALAWRDEMVRASRPLLSVPRYRIPPQLVPTEILEAAGLDEQGRRRNTR